MEMEDSSQKKAKGIVLRGYLKFVKRKWGTPAMKEVMDFAGIEEMPKEQQWLPVELFDRTLEWIRLKKGADMVTEAARFAAKDLGVLTQLFTSVMGVDSLLLRSSNTYPTIFNYGSMKISVNGKSAEVHMQDVVTSEGICRAWKGGLIGLMELSKSTGTVREVPSGSPSDCLYIIEWS